MTPTSSDRATAGRLLRRLREQRGWSWADQARAAGKLFTLQVVLANSAATQEFDAAMAAENYQGWPKLPVGLKYIAERVVRRI